MSSELISGFGKISSMRKCPGVKGVRSDEYAVSGVSGPELTIASKWNKNVFRSS